MFFRAKICCIPAILYNGGNLAVPAGTVMHNFHRVATLLQGKGTLRKSSSYITTGESFASDLLEVEVVWKEKK